MADKENSAASLNGGEQPAVKKIKTDYIRL